MDYRCYGVGIMAVNGFRVPAISLKARDLIVADREVGRTVDGNPVVIEQNDELAEPEMTQPATQPHG